MPLACQFIGNIVRPRCHDLIGTHVNESDDK